MCVPCPPHSQLSVRMVSCSVCLLAYAKKREITHHAQMNEASSEFQETLLTPVHKR